MNLEWPNRNFSGEFIKIGIFESKDIVEWARKILATDNKIKEESLIYIGKMCGINRTLLLFNIVDVLSKKYRSTIAYLIS
ncbi:MAG: hypothetical protein ACP5SH_24080 [Syntrophobacteraceae bacterium]